MRWLTVVCARQCSVTLIQLTESRLTSSCGGTRRESCEDWNCARYETPWPRLLARRGTCGLSKPQTVDGARLLTGMAEIVSAYAARNKLTPRELVEAITHVAQALASVQHATIAPEVSTPLTPEELVTAIRLGRIDGSKPRPLTRAEIAASIQDKYLISFENGLPYSMLRRHLTTMGMTPDEYRAKWGLPEDYPVVALHFDAPPACACQEHDPRQSRTSAPGTAQRQAQIPAGRRCLDHQHPDRCSVSRSRCRRPGTTDPRAARHGVDGDARGRRAGDSPAKRNPRASRHGGDDNA